MQDNNISICNNLTEKNNLVFRKVSTEATCPSIKKDTLIVAGSYYFFPTSNAFNLINIFDNQSQIIHANLPSSLVDYDFNFQRNQLISCHQEYLELHQLENFFSNKNSTRFRLPNHPVAVSFNSFCIILFILLFYDPFFPLFFLSFFFFFKHLHKHNFK